MLAGYKLWSRYVRYRNKSHQLRPEDMIYLRRSILNDYHKVNGQKYSFRDVRLRGRFKVRRTLKDKKMVRNWVSNAIGTPFIVPYPDGFMCNPMRCSRNKRFLKRVGIKITNMQLTSCTSGWKLTIKKVKSYANK